jgi:hypothetical protein
MISGAHEGSAIVSGFPSVSADVIAVIGRQNPQFYFASQQPMIESDMAIFNCASRRAVCNKLK